MYNSIKIPQNLMVEGFGGSWSPVEEASVVVLTGVVRWWWRRWLGAGGFWCFGFWSFSGVYLRFFLFFNSYETIASRKSFVIVKLTY
jgi:hypothetical protein